MAITGVGGPAVRSSGKELCLASIEFETNSTNAPDGLVDPCKVVSTFTRTGVGDFLITLKKRWRRVHAQACLAEDVARVAAPGAIISGGAAANSVAVHVKDNNLAPVETTDETIIVSFELYRRITG